MIPLNGIVQVLHLSLLHVRRAFAFLLQPYQRFGIGGRLVGIDDFRDFARLQRLERLA